MGSRRMGSQRMGSRRRGNQRRGSQRRRAAAVALAIGTVAAVAFTGVGPAVAAAPSGDAPVIDIVDTGASYTTKSLYSYLYNQEADGVLFGHQHDIDDGLTFSAQNWFDPATRTVTDVAAPNSDTKAGTGEYPALFGWDTLALEGREKPGSLVKQNDGSMPITDYLATYGEQNAAALAKGMVRADALGGVNTLSSHMYNFATGKDFNDTSGRVVSQILPGGTANSDFNDYLDLIATTANLAVDADGNKVPIIYRPFHENTGNWFWWGAPYATTGEFKEIFRYTVEYLRDVKGVDNLLYAFSPNGSFGGNADGYLATYPGDAWVDVMGYDSYDYDNTPQNSDAYIASTVTDLAMVTDLAAEHQKIPALTEFGRNGDRTIRVSGNKSLNFYTDLFTAIKEDPKASRIAYMLTWSNWGTGEFYVPYPAYGTVPEHEMYADFIEFFNDPFSVFSGGTSGAYDNDAVAAPAETSIRVVSPASGVRVLTPTTTVRAALTGPTPDRVYFTADGGETQLDLTLGADGYYTGEWNIGADNLTNTSADIQVVADYICAEPVTGEASVILGAEPTLPLGLVDDFESYESNDSLRAAYNYNNATGADISLSTDVKGGGENGVEFSYDFASKSYGGFGKVFTAPQDWSGFNQIEAFLDRDGSNNKLVFQVNTSDDSFEAYPGLATDEAGNVAIAISDFRSKNDQGALTAADLVGVTSFWVYINATDVGAPGPSSIVLDDISAATGDAEPTLPIPDEPDPEPAGAGVVDDFEGYADDAALRSGWTRAGASTLSLSTANKASGTYGAAFPIDLTDGATFEEFQRAINADWSAYDQLSLWVQPDGVERKLTLQLAVGSNSYDYTTTVSGTDPVELVAPFEDFRQSGFKGGDQSLRITPAELADTISLTMFIDATGNSTSRTGVYYFDDIRAEASDGTGTGEPPAALEPSVADDFEGYADDAALRSVWNRNSGVGVSLAPGVGTGANAGAFDYELTAEKNYADFGMYLSSDWSQYDALSVWVTPDAAGRATSVQLKAGKVFWDAPLKTVGADAQVVEIPFSDFVPASYQEVSSKPLPTDRPTAEQLALVENFSFFINPGTGEATGTGTYYLDDIQAVTVDDTEPTQPVQTAPVVEPVQSVQSAPVVEPASTFVGTEVAGTEVAETEASAVPAVASESATTRVAVRAAAVEATVPSAGCDGGTGSGGTGTGGTGDGDNGAGVGSIGSAGGRGDLAFTGTDQAALWVSIGAALLLLIGGTALTITERRRRRTARS